MSCVQHYLFHWVALSSLLSSVALLTTLLENFDFIVESSLFAKCQAAEKFIKHRHTIISFKSSFKWFWFFWWKEEKTNNLGKSFSVYWPWCLSKHLIYTHTLTSHHHRIVIVMHEPYYESILILTCGHIISLRNYINRKCHFFVPSV